MVEGRREGGRCDYCLVGSQRNRSAQKYVVRERGTVSDIINTLETYSESARTPPPAPPCTSTCMHAFKKGTPVHRTSHGCSTFPVVHKLIETPTNRCLRAVLLIYSRGADLMQPAYEIL